MRSRRTPEALWRGAGVRRLPAPVHLLRVRCVFTRSHGRITRGQPLPVHLCKIIKIRGNQGVRQINPPWRVKYTCKRFKSDAQALECGVPCSMPVACTLCARALRALAHARTPREGHSALPPCTAPAPARPTQHPTHARPARAGVHASSDALLSAWRSRHSMPGVARSVALCVLPAPTRADTSLRLGAVLQARLARVLRRQGLRVLRRHCLWRHRLRHRRRWHRLHRAAQPRPGRVQTERPPPSTAGHLTAAEHPVAGRFVYPNAMCSRSSLR